MKVESINSSLHPKCKNLKITIDCNEREQYMKVFFDNRDNPDSVEFNNLMLQHSLLINGNSNPNLSFK